VFFLAAGGAIVVRGWFCVFFWYIVDKGGDCVETDPPEGRYSP
jgi:hypothetical protein